MNKIMEWADIGPMFRDGMSIMFGGFMGVGTPPGIVTALLESNARNLTLIGNDTAYPETGVGPLISNGRARTVVVSHIGTNPITGKKMIAGELDVELVPQGTLIERIRCGGSGLGVGTVVEEGKTKMAVNGKEYLLELPLRADIAIIKAKRADRSGNLVYERAARNFNPVIAFAADLVIAEVDEIVEVGDIDPDLVMTPAALVDKMVLSRGA
jgi:acetate CoA/acetoacetate CoA-transferase alpha subunit